MNIGSHLHLRPGWFICTAIAIGLLTAGVITGIFVLLCLSLVVEMFAAPFVEGRDDWGP